MNFAGGAATKSVAVEFVTGCKLHVETLRQRHRSAGQALSRVAGPTDLRAVEGLCLPSGS